MSRLILAGLLLTLGPHALADDDDCPRGSAQPVVSDLLTVLDGAQAAQPTRWQMPELPDYSGASDQELAQRAAALERDAAVLAPYVASYVQLMDRVAGANFAIWSRLADANAQAAAAADPYRDPVAALMSVPGLPRDWEEQIPYAQQKLLQAALEELVRQMRQDLRTGHVSAPFQPGDIAHESTPEGVVAAMRIDQLLQHAGLSSDFEAHSPASAEDVRALQALDDGVFPHVERHPAAFEAVLYATRDAPDGRFAQYAERGVVPLGTEGLDDALPNGERIAELLDELVREQLALDRALADRGQAPTSAPALDAAVEQLEQLDSNIGRFGQAFAEQLMGRLAFTTEHALVEVDGERRVERVPRELFRPAPVAGPGSRGYEAHTSGDGQLRIYPGGLFAPAAPLSPEQLDELVRIKDSAELLEGNTTGLSVADVAMSPALRDRLGLSPVRYQDWQQPQLAPFLNPLDEIFQPQQAIQQRPAMIDRAALLPREQRQDYLLALGDRAFSRSLDERSATELTAAADNTWLHRTVEILDVPGWLFKGDDREAWIGPRAELYTWRSQRWGEQVDGHIDTATEDSIYGRYAPAMAALREIHDINNQHAALNLRYERQHEETEFATMMYVGFLPLSAFGIAETGVAIARPVVARLGVRATASLADDVARAGDDLLRLADDTLRAMDDAARVADEFVIVGDDALRQTLSGGDELGRLGDEVARAGDELAELGDDVARAGEELVDAGGGVYYNARPVDKLYVNRAGNQRLHVDLAGDYDLRQATNQAMARIVRGNTPEERLAHLVDHVHSDVTYDLAAQQGKYLDEALLPAGEARLGDMVQDGAVVCREKAIFTHQLLGEMGIESRVVTGNVRAHDGVYGHAWVELADGTVVDGTWGRIYLRGRGYPVEEVVKTQVFFTPNKAMGAAEVEQALRGAAEVLESPKLLQQLQRQVPGFTLSPADELLTIGSRVRLPQKKGGVMGWLGGRKTGTITRVERDMVFVQLDGQEVWFPRAEILDINNVPSATPTPPPRPSWRGR